MVGHIVTVAVHGPVEVLFKPVRMAMIRDHFQMVLDCLKHSRCVRCSRHDGPDGQRQAQKRRKRYPPICRNCSHSICPLSHAASRETVLFYPPWGDIVVL